MALVTINFESHYLKNNHNVNIILPDKPFGQEPKEFYKEGKKYKVLWLLHGTFGDYSDWVRKSLIEVYAAERNLMVVMPSALNSVYENWPDFCMGFYMRDYFFEELMPMIYSWFPASQAREDNFVAGLSMGGRGTAKFICAHPEKFAGAAVLSSSPRDLRKVIGGEVDPRTANDIKRCGGVEGFLASDENTWDHIKRLAEMKDPPKLYFACGEDDALYSLVEEFRAYAKEIGLPAVFESEKGYGHEWRFWNKYIERALDVFGIEKTK